MVSLKFPSGRLFKEKLPCSSVCVVCSFMLTAMFGSGSRNSSDTLPCTLCCAYTLTPNIPIKIHRYLCMIVCFRLIKKEINLKPEDREAKNKIRINDDNHWLKKYIRLC